MSLDNSQGDLMCTPRRVQKCLFGLDNSTRKKNTCKTPPEKKRIDNSSEGESDLGPMSPLAFTDCSPSSYNSSPRSNAGSPFGTPEKSSVPLNTRLSGDHVALGLGKNNLDNHHSSFSVLKRSTRAARYSPRRRTIPGSPKHLIRTPLKHSLDPPTPRQLDVSVPSKNEKTSESKFKDFTLSAEKFYSTCEKRMSLKSLCELMNRTKRKRSAPVLSNKRYLKKHRLGQINAGVSHGIRKPKQKSNSQVPKKEMSVTTQNNNLKHTPDTNTCKSPPMETRLVEPNALTTPVQETPVPETDPNKRFFKTKRMMKPNYVVSTADKTTRNNKVKRKLVDDKETRLNNENSPPESQVNKRARLEVDATDLTVDEPEVEASIQQNEVANILKILEADWADDKPDTMETLPTPSRRNILSPVKTVTMLQDVTLSPASELISMTSIMNIKDVEPPMPGNVPLKSIESNNTKTSQKKYYPLFNKEFFANKNFERIGTKKINNGAKENMNWQLSAKRNGSENQYQLDAGQKRFGATQCAECGIVYQLGDPEDENSHLNYHNSRNILKFRGWKTERVVMEDPFTSSRIILIEPEDLKHCWNKVSDILEVVDRDLGLVDAKLLEYQHKKVYLYIRNKTALGVLVAEHIQTAHRMIPELSELNCCTAESTPAKCGINVVWTAMSHRRQGIATKMIDTLRAQFFYGYIMSIDDIAFSTPTAGGKIFAEKYTKIRNFKVYS